MAAGQSGPPEGVKLRLRKPAPSYPAYTGRRRFPVTAAEHFGVELRRRCGKCILWLLGVLLLGYAGHQVFGGLESLQRQIDSHESEVMKI